MATVLLLHDKTNTQNTNSSKHTGGLRVEGQETGIVSWIFHNYVKAHAMPPKILADTRV